jgi:hypothetical protein
MSVLWYLKSTASATTEETEKPSYLCNPQAAATATCHYHNVQMRLSVNAAAQVNPAISSGVLASGLYRR